MFPAKLRVLSYNIHKGYSPSNLRYVLQRLRTSIREVHADLVLLQEVLGHHESVRARIEDWPSSAQFEYLADELWPHYAYGKNSVYTAGHHGNAILSKFPIEFSENHDISLNSYEKRGILHASIRIPGQPHPVHVLCVHLGLFENDRKSQLGTLCQKIASQVPSECPVIVGGDFNDWREKASETLRRQLGLQEAFFTHQGAHAKTFPSWLPLLRLDRLYSRGMGRISAELVRGKVWKDLSDHLPILGEFELPEG